MLLFVSSVLILNLGISTILTMSMASAASNKNQVDMKAIADNINKSLAELRGVIPRALERAHWPLNNTAHQIANE